MIKKPKTVINKIIEEPIIENTSPEYKSSYDKGIKSEGRITKHKGAFDVACITMKSPKGVMMNMMKVLEKNYVKYKKVRLM